MLKGAPWSPKALSTPAVTDIPEKASLLACNANLGTTAKPLRDSVVSPSPRGRGPPGGRLGMLGGGGGALGTCARLLQHNVCNTPARAAARAEQRGLFITMVQTAKQVPRGLVPFSRTATTPRTRGTPFSPISWFLLPASSNPACWETKRGDVQVRKFKLKSPRDLLGRGPVVKTPRCPCRGHGFDPWSGN